MPRSLTDRERRARAMRAQRAQQTTASVPGITGGQYTPNTSWSGMANGSPYVWQPPAYYNPPAPAPTGPVPTTPTPGGYQLPPATTSIPGPWNIPGTPAPATNPADYSGPQAPASGYLGPGANGFYNQNEFWDTLAGYSQDSFRGPGWYGSGGDYLGGLGETGLGNADNPEAVAYNPTYGQNTVGGQGNTNYQGGSRGFSGWFPTVAANLGVQSSRGRAWRKQQGAGRRGAGPFTNPQGYGPRGGGGSGQQPSAAPTPNWMSGMVGFNP